MLLPDLPPLIDIFYYVNRAILAIALLGAIVGTCRDAFRHRPPRGSHSAVGYDKITVPTLEGVSVDDEAIVMPWTGEMLPPSSVRRLARYACDHRELGWEALVDEINKGAPPYPIIDELVCACADLVRSKGPVVGLDQELEFRFETSAEQSVIDTVIRYVRSALQDQGHEKFYLDVLMRASEKDLLWLMQCFLELYDQIGSPGVVTVKWTH